MTNNRQCMVCGTQIVECMGFVLARDYLKNKIPPREICGKCIFFMEQTWPKMNEGNWHE
jgi:hypothetical protein